MESSLFSKLFSANSETSGRRNIQRNTFITPQREVLNFEIIFQNRFFSSRVLVRRSIHAEQKKIKKKFKQRPRMSGTWKYARVVFAWNFTLLRLGRHIRVHLTTSGGTSLSKPGCTERGGLASRQSVLLSLVCGQTVEILLRSLGFLKERENTREKTSGEKASVSHDRRYFSCFRGKYSLGHYKPLLIICFQMQGKERKIFSWKTRPGGHTFSVLTHIKHLKETLTNVSDYSFPLIFQKNAEDESTSLVLGREALMVHPSAGGQCWVAALGELFHTKVHFSWALIKHQFQTQEMRIPSSFHSLLCLVSPLSP